MAHYGTLREFQFKEDVEDIRGSDVYGRDDEKLGEISDVIFDHNSGNIQYAVVDTGGWLSSRKFLVPAENIEPRPDHDDDYRVSMSKEEVERLPQYDENRMQNEHEWRDFDEDYREKWTTTGDVMHREGSTNIITPDPSEMPPGISAAEHVSGDLNPQRLAGTFPSAAPDPGKIRMRPAGTASRAEDTKIPGSARTASDSREWSERDESLSQPQGSGNRLGSDYRDADDLRTEREEMNQHTHEAVLPTSGAGVTSESDANWSGMRGDVDEGVLPNSRTGMRSENEMDNANRSNIRSQRCGSRWQAFEDHLRKNRVDITSSCRSCGPEKERAA